MYSQKLVDSLTKEISEAYQKDRKRPILSIYYFVINANNVGHTSELLSLIMSRLGRRGGKATKRIQSLPKGQLSLNL